MAASSDYRLGSIWLVTFDPSVGTEIRKTRHFLYYSDVLAINLGTIEFDCYSASPV